VTEELMDYPVSGLEKNKNKTTTNSDGLINWLRQPGRLCI
jgi:hypothetical protein